jgi:hypothetical protein
MGGEWRASGGVPAEKATENAHWMLEKAILGAFFCRRFINASWV